MQLDPVGILFSNSWKRYQERFSAVTPIFLVPLAIITIGELLITRGTLPAFVLGGLLNLIGSIVSIPASIAMIAAVGKNEDFAQSYRTGIALFWASLWMSLLTMLASFGGFVLLIIPGIILGVQLAFAQYVLVLENKNGLMALAQSREYVKGNWWAFVGRGLVLGLVFGAIMFVIYLPFKLLLGAAGAAIVYGILLLLFTPFSVSYSYEIFDNMRRLKPDAAEVAAKTETGFLKVCMVVGVVGIIAVFILLIAAIAFLPTAVMKFDAALQSADYASSTMPGAGQMQISPMSGPTGTMVVIGGPAGFDATNTIFMNGLIAARNVAPSADGTLSFTVPSSLGPDCDPGKMCPQFLIKVMPGAYGIAVKNSHGLVSVGTFTVTAGALQAIPGGLK